MSSAAHPVKTGSSPGGHGLHHCRPGEGRRALAEAMADGRLRNAAQSDIREILSRRKRGPPDGCWDAERLRRPTLAYVSPGARKRLACPAWRKGHPDRILAVPRCRIRFAREPPEGRRRFAQRPPHLSCLHDLQRATDRRNPGACATRPPGVGDRSSRGVNPSTQRRPHLPRPGRSRLLRSPFRQHPSPTEVSIQVGRGLLRNRPP